MNQLIFIANELQDPANDLKLPLKFISFGIVPGKFYTQIGGKSKFIAPPDVNRNWGNKVVYGSLFVCKDFFFYSRMLDAYHACSLSSLLRNHPLDLQHRKEEFITPIRFDNLDKLSRLIYEEKEPISANVYFGNLDNPAVLKRIKSNNPNYRIVDGIDAKSFKKFYYNLGGV